MTDLDVTPRSPASADGRRADLGREVLRRRPLPGSRAVAGGLLIAVAAVVTFWAYARSSRTPRQLYVVAVHQLQPGDRISAADLGVVPLDLPDAAVRRQVFGSPQQLVGASVLAPIAPGSLIESAQVVGRAGAAGTREISISVDRSRAVGGTLKPGEYVDVLSTFGQGASSYTIVMVPHVEVLTVSGDVGGSLGTTGNEVIVLAVADSTSAEAVADAEVATQLTLVRAAEQADGAPVTTVAPFRPPSGASNAATGGG